MLTNVPPTPPDAWIELQDEQQFADRPEIALLESRLGKGYIGWSGFQGNLTIGVAPESLLEALRLLRDEGSCDHFSFMTCAHWPENPAEGFQLVYQLYSRALATFVRLQCWIADREPVHAASVCAVYPAADWHESEVYDLFGIHFDGHPELRRLFTPGMYEGFPLRRDFPLEGEALRDFQKQLISQWNDSGESHDYEGSLNDAWMDRANS